jgi:hypothetical protein
MGPAPHQLPDHTVDAPQARRHEDKSAIEDAVILDETRSNPAPQGPPSALSFSPALIKKGERFELFVSRETGRAPWGFWGGVAAISGFIALVLRGGASGFHDVRIWAAAITLLTVAVVMFKWAPTDSLERVRTWSIDPTQRQLVWHQPGEGADGITLNFEEVSEIVFGMVFVPADAARPDARIHAFTVLVRDARDQLIPVIAACPSKEDLFELAKLLSHHTQAPITQVGAGVREG